MSKEKTIELDGEGGLVEIDENGNRRRFRTGFGLYVDMEGRDVERPKSEHQYRYTYSPFVVRRYGTNDEISCADYTDRLRQWDHEKHDRLYKKHLSGKSWATASKSSVESFMRDYHDDQTIRLIVVQEHCNMATGFTLWCIHIHWKKIDDQRAEMNREEAADDQG